MPSRYLSSALCIGLCLAAAANPQSIVAAETKPSSNRVPPEAMSLSADFEGALDPSVNTAYLCKGVVKFIAAPTTDRPDNEALLLTLDPTKPSAIGRCEPNNAPSERAELAEPDDLRLPLGTEVWYGFQFLIPAAMKGKFAGQRVVIAQLKQHPNTCPLGPQPFGLATASVASNPTISLRIIEDAVGDVMGLQLAVAGDHVRKIPVGQLMRHRDSFLDRWHEVLLHAKVMPQDERPDDAGFVEGWLDGQPFADGLYGVLDGKGTADPAEPFGYAGLVGCTYFKYGIYRDRQAEPWTIGFDRFRRGATRAEVEIPVP